MDALIFGASGQDGYYLSRLCKSRGMGVLDVSRTNATIIGDVADGPFVTQLIRTHRPAFIFQLAARSTTRHEAAQENHVTIGSGALNVLEAACRHSPDSRVFLAGSGLQFVNHGNPISEDDPFDASSPYAAVRNYSTFLARYYRGLGLKVFFGYLYHHESPLRKTGHMSKTIAEAARRAVSGEKFVLEVGDLTVEREWTFAGDVVEAMLILTEQNAMFETNVGSGSARNFSDWAAACFSTVGRDWRDYITQKTGFVSEYARLVSNPARIHSLGWRARTGFDELAEMMVAA